MMTNKFVEIAGHEARFVPATRFKEHTPHKYKEFLDYLVANPDQMVEIRCKDEAEGKELQSGFHSSGTGRRLKKLGYKIETTLLLNNVIQVRITGPVS